jgi:hypothetical protein
MTLGITMLNNIFPMHTKIAKLSSQVSQCATMNYLILMDSIMSLNPFSICTHQIVSCNLVSPRLHLLASHVNNPYLVPLLVRMHVFECYVVLHGSKNGYQSDTCLKWKECTTYSNCKNHSRLNDQHNKVGGYIPILAQKSSDLQWIRWSCGL